MRFFIFEDEPFSRLTAVLAVLTDLVFRSRVGTAIRCQTWLGPARFWPDPTRSCINRSSKHTTRWPRRKRPTCPANRGLAEGVFLRSFPDLAVRTHGRRFPGPRFACDGLRGTLDVSRSHAARLTSHEPRERARERPTTATESPAPSLSRLFSGPTRPTCQTGQTGQTGLTGLTGRTSRTSRTGLTDRKGKVGPLKPAVITCFRWARTFACGGRTCA